jgi:hypothetical protein
VDSYQLFLSPAKKLKVYVNFLERNFPMYSRRTGSKVQYSESDVG